MRDEAIGIRLGSGVPGAEDRAESTAATESWASRIILQPTDVRRVRAASLERVPLWSAGTGCWAEKSGG